MGIMKSRFKIPHFAASDYLKFPLNQLVTIGLDYLIEKIPKISLASVASTA